MEAAPRPDGAPESAQAKSELPTAESPPLSPGTEMPSLALDTPEPAIVPMAAAASATRPRWVLKARHKRYGLLAVSVTFAAALGAVVGALASGGFSAPARPDVAGSEENRAMQQSIARLEKEIATLKASLEHANVEVTGSTSAPLPSPRPAARIAAADAQPPTWTPIVRGWTIRDARRGYVYVENHGDVYQVVPGAPLPGLGPVQSVKRHDGRWMVLTPKGIIVSMRDRRYFESF